MKVTLAIALLSCVAAAVVAVAIPSKIDTQHLPCRREDVGKRWPVPFVHNRYFECTRKGVELKNCASGTTFNKKCEECLAKGEGCDPAPAPEPEPEPEPEPSSEEEPEPVPEPTEAPAEPEPEPVPEPTEAPAEPEPEPEPQPGSSESSSSSSSSSEEDGSAPAPEEPEPEEPTPEDPEPEEPAPEESESAEEPAPEEPEPEEPVVVEPEEPAPEESSENSEEPAPEEPAPEEPEPEEPVPEEPAPEESESAEEPEPEEPVPEEPAPEESESAEEPAPEEPAPEEPVPEESESAEEPAPEPEPEVPAPEDSSSSEESGCPVTCNEGDEYLEDPNSCNSFIQCSNGKPYVMPCPAGLVFNPNVRPGPVCDWPSAYECKPRGCGAPEPTPEVCPPVDCSGDRQYFPNAGNCNAFIQCSNGAPYNMPCPAGLHFNAVLNVCDWPANAGCSETCNDAFGKKETVHKVKA